MHRTGAGSGPIWVRLRKFTTLELLSEGAEGLRRIFLDPRIASASPVEEDAIDHRFSGRESFNQCGNDFAIVHPLRNPETAKHCCHERSFEPAAPLSQNL